MLVPEFGLRFAIELEVEDVVPVTFDRRQVDRQFVLAQEFRVVAAAITIIGGDRLFTIHNARAVVHRCRGQWTIALLCGHASGHVSERHCHCERNRNAGAAAACLLKPSRRSARHDC